ncbi:MAG: LamG-like jellyroll fold domain-containing protein [Candidatus Hermodarchaeota archaeon]
MRKGAIISLSLVILFFLPSVIPMDGSSMPAAVMPTPFDSQGLLADSSGPYTGKGGALDVSFQGSFTTNTSTWSATGQSYAADYTLGTSFSVQNASTVSWTAYVSVSPPAEVEDVSFSVDYPRLEWIPTAVTDPLGVSKTYSADWTFSLGVLTVSSTAVTTYGLWKVEFLGGNHLYDMLFDVGGGPEVITATYDIGQDLEIIGTSSFINGGTSQLVLTDPTGTVWQTMTNTTSGFSSHVIPSFQYKKDITINQAAVGADLDFFPVMVSLIDTGLHDHAQSSGNDIVFVQNGMVLDHEIEIYNPTYSPTETRLIAWVKANVSGTVDTVISMYYGNPIVGPQENPSAVWTSSYSAVYHLGESATDEATNAVHSDSTSNSYYGNQNGNADATGLVGVGQDFDGTNDKVVVDSSLGFEPIGDLTISGWFKLDSPFTSSSGTSQVLMAKYLTADDDMHIALAGTDYSQATMTKGSLVFKMENNNAQKYKCTQRITWGSSNWFYFAATVDADTPNNNQIYINGLLDTNATRVAGGASYGNLTFQADWEIGGGFTDGQLPGGQGFFDGVMDEVRVSNTLRSGAWLLAEYYNLALPGSFYSVGLESESSVVSPKFTKAIDATAIAGLWTACLHYNDSGSSVDHRVGEYQREFIVQHDSTLTIDSPTGIATKVVGDLLYIVVNLTDDITSGFVSGATVTANWTDTGTPTIVTLDDYGDGRYGKVLNTSDLQDNKRWRVDIQSSHPYYNDASSFFNLDLTHDTTLTYDSLTTTPVGWRLEVSLLYKDMFDGSPIAGATIRFSNGTLADVAWAGGGRYNLSLSSFGLSKGNHMFSFVAEPQSSYLADGTVDVTFTIRAHQTAVSVSGDLLVPFGEDTPLTIQLIDLDNQTIVPIGSVSAFTFTTSSHGVQSDNSPADYLFTLVTNGWSITPSESVTLSVTFSNSNYKAPDDHVFSIEIRAHYTSVSVSGDLDKPLGNNTPITVILTDLDTGSQIDIGNVASFSFASSYGTQNENSLSSFDVTLSTSGWAVGSTTVTLTVAMSSSNYFAPAAYDFDVVMESLTIYMYHEPSNLRFSTGQDFFVILRVNVSEPGPSYGSPVQGLIQGEFSVPGYSISIDTTDQLIGRYSLTISAASFSDGYHTITVYLDPSSANYASTTLVITFRYEPGLAALSSPSYPQVTTPFGTDVQISLTYEDADSGTPITGATIGGDIPTYGQAYAAGAYTIWIDVAGYAEGSHQFTLWADEANYQNKTLTFTLVIRYAFTYALPSVGALDIPLGNDPVFTVDYHDIDNDVPVSNDTFEVTVVSSWGNFDVVYLSGPGLYEITFNTVDTDTLVQNLVVTFTFSRPNYQDGAFAISVTIRPHNTDFRLVSAVAPTTFNGIINISLYYGDIDNAAGIGPLGSLTITAENDSGSVLFSTIDEGGGFYTVQIAANQFGQGLQTFNITFSWSGPIQKYQTKWLEVNANVIGEDSRLTLMVASEPTAYLGIMSYVFFYSDQGRVGITNDTFNVHISVSFQGTSVDLGQVNIQEIDSATQPGNYSIDFNTTLFSATGLYYMNVYINWTQGVAPFYTNRFDVISVRVLPRDTLVSVNPPSPTYYGETAWFIFTFDDVTGGSNVPIADDPALDITLSLPGYSVNYLSGTKQFNVSFDTSLLGAPLGSRPFTLDVTWAGAPFYTNRTGRTVSVVLLSRLTVLDYQAPAPTQYQDNVTFTVTWTDVTNVASGISIDTLVLYDDATPIPYPTYYSWTSLGNGQYEITVNTTYYTDPGFYNLIVELTSADFFISDVSASRVFNVRQRVTLLSAEPTDRLPYNSTLQFVLNYQDLLTLGVIGNGSGLVTFEILNASTWLYSISWNAVLEQYDFTVETYNHPTLAIDTPYALEVKMSYANLAPFYGADTAYILFELRSRSTKIVLQDTPESTAYLDYANFTVFYRDLDAAGSVGIVADSIEVYKGAFTLTQGIDYLVSNLGVGVYLISVNTTALDGLGTTVIDVFANWNPSNRPYHDDAAVSVSIVTTERDANVQILVPPSQTQYWDNVTLTFAYYDLGRGVEITSITVSDIEVWADGVLLASDDFILTSVGPNFQLEVNSSVLSPTLVSGYNLTIFVDWNDLVAPYYLDDSTMVRVTLVGRKMTFSADPISDADLGELLSITFRLQDLDQGWLVAGAIISFDGQTVSLTEGVNYWVNDVGGVYTIDVDTLALGSPGPYKFDLDIAWNPGTAPFYSALATIELTGVVREIDTDLTLLSPATGIVEVYWKDQAYVEVSFDDLFNLVVISGATVRYDSAIANGFFDESIATPGTYNAFISTENATSPGTQVVTITASLSNYETAVAYVTLLIKALPSEMIPISPVSGQDFMSRGSAIEITIYLRDDYITLAPIVDSKVLSVLARFEGLDYPLVYNGTVGYYELLIPADGPTILDIGTYNVQITATFNFYDPATYLFRVTLTQSATELRFTGTTAEDMSRVYTQSVNFSVMLVLPDFGDAPFYNSTITWSVVGTGLSGTLANPRTGYYSTIVDTTTIGYGIWPISIRARTWANASEFADTSIQLTLTITRIPTTVIRPGNLDVYWGWSGNIEFIYSAGSFGNVTGANAPFTWDVVSGNATEGPNGRYFVFVNTSLVTPGFYTLSLTLSKENYQEGPASILIRVLEVPTSIFVDSVVYTPAYAGELLSMTDLQIPLGESMVINLWYNDTDDSEGYLGGLPGAFATANSFLRGPTIDTPLNVSLVDLGLGLYRIWFDTTDPAIAAIVTEEPYRFYIELGLANRRIAEILIRIVVINIPTELTIIGDVPDTIINGDTVDFEVFLNDTWHNAGLAGQDIVLTVEGGLQGLVGLDWEEIGSGRYRVILSTGGIMMNAGSGFVTISVEIPGYAPMTTNVLLSVLLSETDRMFQTVLVFGLPISLVLFILLGAYVRVWSVPKKIRQINGQIKKLRKGKMPEPIADVKSRRELIAGLFNSTFSELKLTRVASQMPEESVPIEIPEMGDLLIQLAILTNLDADELDEFKADISKMKISEQAAFVREVIEQEAVRAARREGKTVEEILNQVAAQAARQLEGVEEEIPAPQILDVKPEVAEEVEEPIVGEPEEAEEMIEVIMDDRLSTFEIEDIKIELVRRGVPAHEIDTIIEQVKDLPRELVDELIKSVDRNEK